MVIRTCCGHPLYITEKMDIVGVDKACGDFRLVAMAWCCCSAFGLTHRPVFHLRFGKRLRDEELQLQCLRLGHDLETQLSRCLAHRGTCANTLCQYHCAFD